MSAKPASMSSGISPKSGVIALFLCLFLGIFGAHRFYVGKTKSAILMLVTLGGLGLWMLVDLVLIACGEFTDSDGRQLTTARFKPVLGIAVLVVGIILLYVALFGGIFTFVTGGASRVVQSQLVALRANDIEKAYSYTSTEFQKITSYNDFKSFVEQVPALRDYEKLSFTNVKIMNDKGLLAGTITGKDGSVISVEYLLIYENKTWKIEGITTNPVDTDASTDTNSNEASNSAASAADTSDKSAKILTFEDNAAKYSIQYPGDWYYEQPDKTSVLFSGKKGSPSYYSTVTIQILPMKKNGGIYNSVKDIVADLKGQIKSKTTDVKFISEGAIKLPQNPEFTGQYFEVTYTYKGETMQKMQYIIIRPDGKSAYSWGYTTPADRYQSDLANAQAMYDSWLIH